MCVGSTPTASTRGSRGRRFYAQPYYEGRFGVSHLPAAEGVYSRVLSLPIGNGMTVQQARDVAECSAAFFDGNGR